MLQFNAQPTLENELIKIRPLQADDFEAVYAVASDPLVWEQHPNPNRYKQELFRSFFDGGIESGSAFVVIDNQTGQTIGSSRYYEINEADKSIAVGYTFLARSHWGGRYNQALKALMIDYAFTTFDRIVLHIGATNIRSQKAAQKIGAVKAGEVLVESPGEANKLNFIFHLNKPI